MKIEIDLDEYVNPKITDIINKMPFIENFDYDKIEQEIKDLVNDVANKVVKNNTTISGWPEGWRTYEPYPVKDVYYRTPNDKNLYKSIETTGYVNPCDDPYHIDISSITTNTKTDDKNN